jgi:hypothetical protein
VRSWCSGRSVHAVYSTFALGFSILALGVYLPAYLQQAQHHTAAQTGLIMLPPAAVAITVPLLTDAGSRGPVLACLVAVGARCSRYSR